MKRNMDVCEFKVEYNETTKEFEAYDMLSNHHLKTTDQVSVLSWIKKQFNDAVDECESKGDEK